MAFLLLSVSGFSQPESSNQKQADKEIDIIKIYEQVVIDGYADAFIYRKLATSFYFKNEYENAKKYYEKLLELDKKMDEEVTYRYNQTLRALGLNCNQEITFSKS